jgi:hypothetical protein
MTQFPGLLEGRVVGHDIPNRRLIVELPSVQLLGIGVKMLYHGPADGVRVHHRAMPGRGTWGICAFPAGDPINGIWLGSFYNALLTAHTTANDPFAEYSAHWSGAYEFMDVSGRWTKSFPDGTWIQCSDQVNKPSFRRQIINPDQTQQFQDFSDSERVPDPPDNPYTFTINHGSGAVITIDSSGNIGITAKSGQLVTVKANDLVVNAADKVSLLAPTVAMNGNLEVSGTVIAGFSGSDQVNLQTHRHGIAGTPIAAQTIPPTPNT